MKFEHTYMRPSFAPARQRGAVLFVAMMILIVLTLLGLSAAQVTTLQERMSAIYRSDHMAFANADGLMAERERELRASVSGNHTLCSIPYDSSRQVARWLRGDNLDNATAVDSLQAGSRFAALLGSLDSDVPYEMGGLDCLFLQVSAQAHDDPNAKSSHVILQSIFTP